jgi:lysophospholipase L1-like esterase
MKDEKLTKIMFRSLQKDASLASFDEWVVAGDFAQEMRFFPHALNCYQRAVELKQDDQILNKINDTIDRITNVLEYVPEKISPKIEDIRLSNPLDPAKWLGIANSTLKELSDLLSNQKVTEADLDAAKFALGFTAYTSLRSGNDIGTINDILSDLLEKVNLSNWNPKKLNLTELSSKKGQEPIRMVAMGDNITLGLQPDWSIKFQETYPYLYAKESGHGISLANNSISGAGVMDLCLYMGRDLINYKPDIVVLMLGNNDAWLGTEIIPAYEALLEVNIKALIKLGINVVLMSPIPHIASGCPSSERPTDVDLSELDIKPYSEACQRVAAKLDCVFVDTVSIFPEDESIRQSYFINKLNQPNREGQDLIKSALLKMSII